MLPQILYFVIPESVGEISLVSRVLWADAEMQSTSLHRPFASTRVCFDARPTLMSVFDNNHDW